MPSDSCGTAMQQVSEGLAMNDGIHNVYALG